MRPFLFLSLSFLLTVLFSVETEAAQTSELVDTEPEAALKAEVLRLDRQLENARQKIHELETELESAKNTVTMTQQALAAAKSGATRPPISREMPNEGLSLPASITSLGPEELLLGGVEDISRLEFLVPGLRYGQTGHDVRLSMRGSRTNSVGPEAASIVGIYEDGVFIPTTTQGLDSLLDVQKIDVLRGPQLTKFGQNAYAGAINIVSNKPDFDGIHGYAEAENGLPDKTRWRLALNIPVSDTLAFRLAGLSESRSGWIRNNGIEADVDDLNDRKVQTIRLSALWRPSDKFDLLFWSRYQDENGTGSAPWGYQQIGAYINGELEPGHQFAPNGASVDLGPWDVFRNFISTAEFEHLTSTLTLNWDMGFARLKWINNVAAFDGLQTYDNDYSDRGNPVVNDFAGWSTSQDSRSSELRLSSNGGGALNWLVGLYWFDREADWGWLESAYGTVSQPDWDVVGTYLTDTKAVFGKIGYDFSDRFRVSAGLRWNEDSKTLKSGEQGSWDDILWEAGFDYDINEQMMAYISTSTSYLAGGINSAPGVNPVWEPEKLTAYEIGLKTALLGGDLQLSLAAWYNEFKDVQSQSFLVQPFPGSPEATEYTANGGSLDASGIEAEIHWSPTPKLKFSSNIAYTDARFADYVTVNLNGLGDIPGHTNGDQLSYNGWRPALTPEWVVGLRASYTFEFQNWGALTPYLQSTFASDYYASDINLPGVRQAAHSRTDLRLIWQTPVNFRIQFYYLNAEETATLNWARVYNPATRPGITTLQANWNNPVTYGIIFDYTF